MAKSTGTPAQEQNDTRSLHDRLVDAALRLEGGVGKDAKNEYAKYRYTSVEGMLAACRSALLAEGVCVRRTHWDVVGDINADSVIVISSFNIRGGVEDETYKVAWPAFIGKQRPMDKAIAGALSSTWTYWLRDLLMVNRPDELEMDQRDDSGFNSEEARERRRQADAEAEERRAKEQQRKRAAMLERAHLLVEEIEALEGSAARRERANAMRMNELARLRKDAPDVAKMAADEIRRRIDDAEADEAINSGNGMQPKTAEDGGAEPVQEKVQTNFELTPPPPGEAPEEQNEEQNHDD